MKDKSKSWAKKIRADYRGIISDEQIEATVKYWDELITKEIQSARAEAVREALERAQKELVKRFMKKPADAYDRLTKLLKEYKKPLSPEEEQEVE